MQMLPNTLFNMMWARKPNNMNEFFNDLQAHKDMYGATSLAAPTSFQYFPEVAAESANTSAWAQQFAQTLATTMLTAPQITATALVQPTTATVTPATATTAVGTAQLSGADTVDALTRQLAELNIRLARAERPRRTERPAAIRNAD